MQNMQAKITALAEDRVTRYHAELINSPGGASNTGRWYIQRGTQTFYVIDYDFQQAYGTFKIVPPKDTTLAKLIGGDAYSDSRFRPWTRSTGMIYYHDQAAVDALLDLIGVAIPPATSPEPGWVPAAELGGDNADAFRVDFGETQRGEVWPAGGGAWRWSVFDPADVLSSGVVDGGPDPRGEAMIQAENDWARLQAGATAQAGR